MVTAEDARVALLSRLIDHAPLFPPASLGLPDALAEDRRARESASAFVLGRFGWPVSRLDELPDVGRGETAVLDGHGDFAGTRGDCPRTGTVSSFSALEPDTRAEAGWRGGSAGVDELARARRQRLQSIGSCSFFEPVEELEALGVLPL